MKKVTVAGVQISVKPNNIKANINKILEWHNTAVKTTKAKIIVFPESITTGFNPGISISDFYDFLPFAGEMLAPVRKISRASKTFTVLPTYEKTNKKNVIYNSSFLIDDNGKILGVYRKTHLFPTERKSAGGWSTPGNGYPVFKTKYGNIGMMLCYDGDFPEVARILAVQGAEIILRPSALLRTYEIWEMTNMARAYDNHTYVVAVNAVGADAGGSHYYGHSMIVSPIGRKLALGRGTEDIVYAELSPDPIKKITYGSDAPMIFDHLEDRNVGTYKNFLTKKAKSPFEPHKRIKY